MDGPFKPSLLVDDEEGVKLPKFLSLCDHRVPPLTGW